LIDEENKIYASVVSGNKRVDLGKLKSVLGVRDLRLAKASEVKRYLGYEIGEVPPLCLNKVSKVVVDEEILSKRRVLGGGGSINSLLEFSPEVFNKYGDKLIIAKISI